jgi:membrane-bound lytic murein transglycosylase D
MPRSRPVHAGIVGVVTVALIGCATRVPAPTQVLPAPVAVVEPAPAPAAPVEAPPAAVLQADPVVELIAVSTLHFEVGERELLLGRPTSAKSEFDRALEILSESPPGTRTDPRLRAHFDRLAERMNAYESTVLAQGDGFAEQRQESAGIDEVLEITRLEIPVPTPETTQAVAADLAAIIHDIEIPLNAKVLSFVQLFTGRLKAFLEEGLNRGVQYLPMIQSIFRAEGLPLDLAYVPLVESAFKPTALSRAKARGIWQFMRGTALENGLKHDWYIDERAEPEKATRAAARYLKTLHTMFDGDWHLALASYNGGPGRVQRAIKRSGRTDFWKLTASPRYLPRETRNYVPLILAAIVIARNPGMYGFDIQPIEEFQHETVNLTAPIDLRRVAEWVGTPVQAIQELNPELRRWTTPVGAAEYELKVPIGTADVVRTQLAETDSAQLDWHTVTKGETLVSIAKKLKVTRTDLAQANYLSIRARLETGQRLVIPRAPAVRLAARPENSPPPAELELAPAVVVAATTSTLAQPASEPESVSVVYRVKAGDTLSSIARLYRTTVASLKAWNRLPSSSIQVGQRLTIFITRGATATN